MSLTEFSQEENPNSDLVPVMNLSAKEALEIQFKNQNAKIEAVVISFDGSKDNILDKVSNIRKEDFKFVLEEVNKIVGVEDIKKKGNQDTEEDS